MNTFAIALMGLRLTTASGDLLMRRLAGQDPETRRLENPADVLQLQAGVVFDLNADDQDSTGIYKDSANYLGFELLGGAYVTDGPDRAHWDLANGPLQKTQGTLTESNTYTHAYVLKWRESDAGWRTLLRHSSDHCAIVEHATKNLGFYSNRDGGFMDSDYDITPNQDRWEVLVVTGESTDGAIGTSTFWAEDPAGGLTSVGTSDRVCSGMDYYRIGWEGQSPGKVARVMTWNRVLSAEEIGEVYNALQPGPTPATPEISGYQYLFDGCPRGFTTMQKEGDEMSLSQCAAVCDESPSCAAFEVNGCIENPGDCGELCWTFHNPIQEIHNGECDTSGNQKAYKKIRTGALSIAHHVGSCGQCGLDWCNGFYDLSQSEFDAHYVVADNLATWGCDKVHSGTAKIRVGRRAVYAVEEREDAFCPPIMDASGPHCRNVLSPPIQDKTEAECKELCKNNPKCLWAATGPSHCQNCNYGPFPLKKHPSGGPAPFMHIKKSRAPNGQCVNVHLIGHDLFALEAGTPAHCEAKPALRLGGCKNAQWEAPLDLGMGKITVQVRSDEVAKRDPSDTMQIFHVASDGTERQLWEGVNSGCFPVYCMFTFDWPGKGTMRVVAASSNDQYLDHMAITKLEYTPVEPGFTFHHEGHCASGWLGANTVEESLQGCYERCEDESAFGYETAPCAYFAYEKETGTCATYSGEAGCPDDDLFATYKSYKMIRVPGAGETTKTYHWDHQSGMLGWFATASDGITVKNAGSHGIKGMLPSPWEDRDGAHSAVISATSENFCNPSRIEFKIQGGMSPSSDASASDYAGIVLLRNDEVINQWEMSQNKHVWETKVFDVSANDKADYKLQLRDGKTGGWGHIELQDVVITADFAASCDPQPTCYLEYCNAHSDLMNAFCGGAQCTGRAHYKSCKSHWETYRGVNLQTRSFNPETCKPITLEELFCPPMQDVSGQHCRNVLSPPVQDKTEEECKELCRTNPKCLWAATGPSHCQNCNYGPFPLKNIPSSSPAPLMHVRRSRAPNGQCPVVTRTPTSAPTMNDLSSLRSYEHLEKACVYGGNIVKYADKTVEECRDLCDREDACKAFEYGVAYGGHRGSYQPRDCQLQSYSFVGTCNGAEYNLDLYVKPDPVTIECNMRPGPLARMDLNKDFRIHLQVTADQDWVQAGSGGGGIFGFRDNKRGGNFGLYARFNGGLHYAIHAGDATGRVITTGSYGQPTFYKYAMNLGQTYDMIIEWTGGLFTWTIDGETVLSRDAPNGFGSHHRQKMMCYGIGGGAKGFKGTVKVLQME